MSEQTKEPDIVEIAARAYYAKLTEHCAVLRPGAPFKAWEELPQEQRTMQLAATRSAIAEITRLRAERPGWREGWEVARAAASEVAEGLRREYAGWAKNFPEEDRESDLAKALVCQTIALAIRALHPSVAEGRQPKGE